MIEENLGRAEFFEDLSEEELAEFASGAEACEFAFGEEIIREGRESECMFVVVFGGVEIVKKIPGGERVIARLDSGRRPTIVGERGLLDKSGASATVRAASRVEAVKVRRGVFRDMIRAGSPAAFKVSCGISRTIARRLARLDEEVVATIREVEKKGEEADLEAFRDRLVTDWIG